VRRRVGRSESSRGEERGLAHFNLNEVTRSARTAGALRVILPVAHGERMRYGYVEIQFKNNRTYLRHKHLSTLVASASQPIQTLGLQVRVLEPKFFYFIFKINFLACYYIMIYYNIYYPVNKHT
jgi:hypothetical protein